MSGRCDGRWFEIALNGRLFRVPRTCPHRGGWLRLGTVNEATGTLKCPLHHATFEIATGRRVSGPPCGDLLIEEGPLEKIRGE